MKLKIVEERVKDILTRVKDTRKDDFKLVVVYYLTYQGELIGEDVMSSLFDGKKNGLTSFESITRARRKIQSDHSELLDEETQKKRLEKEDEFHQYYRLENMIAEEEFEKIVDKVYEEDEIYSLDH